MYSGSDPRDRSRSRNGQNHKRKRNKEKTKWGALSTIVLVLAIGVFAFSLYQLAIHLLPYWQGRQESQHVQQLAIRTDPPPGVDETTWQGLWIDFEALLETNPDTVAWLQFESPEIINYPVVHSHDNQEYLHRSFTGEKSILGSIFMDMNNNADFMDRNTIIYGHRMRIGGEMFAQLGMYEDIEHVRQYPKFMIYTPDGKVRLYEVFAVAIINEIAFQYQTEFMDDDEFAAYIERAIGESKINIDWVQVLPTDRIVTLSTCTPTPVRSERLIVQAVLRDILVNVPDTSYSAQP